MQLTRPVAAALAVVAVLSTLAHAHEFWIQPSSFRPPPNTVLKVDLRIGDTLPGESFPRKGSIIENFAIHGPDDRVQEIVGRDAQSPAGLVRIVTPGVHVLGYRSKPSSVELEPVKFEHYLKDKGLEKVVDARAAADQSKANGREMFSRAAKCIVRTQDATGSRGFDRILGYTLELVPLNDPTSLKSDEPLIVKLLYKDKPATGLLVIARNFADPTSVISARTGADGRASLLLPKSGEWIVSAVEMVKAPEGLTIGVVKPEWESLWASLTFQTPDWPITTPTTTAAETPKKEARP